MIKIKNLSFEYFDRDEEGNLTDMINAIGGISFDAKKGEFIGVIGKNGSGKSTFAKILNRLLVPIEGTIIIGEKDARDEDNILDIRKKVGMVFQNPDDQIIGSVVCEDVAFGAENIGIPQEELWDRVFDAIMKSGLGLSVADSKDFAERRINTLSGGEKQKVAIAGVLAMKPECIVLDESTSMLDPVSRWEIIELMNQLNKKLGITIIMITHMMDELIYADTIYVMNQGTIAMKGRKEKIFSEPEFLKDMGLERPVIVEIKEALYEQGLLRDRNIFSVEALVERLKKEHPYSFELNLSMPDNVEERGKIDPRNAILMDDVSYSYGKENVLKNVSLSIAKGEYVAVVGSTGSGKSTLLQHIPGLIKAKSGSVYVDGIDVADRTTDISKLRCKIGYVFQYPSQQLFAKNVYEDVVFGPRNVGVREVEAEKRAYDAISLVGLSDEIYDMPIYKLSGGQKRRVALAGVLAMKPEYLILDEPVAGLDPAGREEMLQIIENLHKEQGITIIIVSHDVESVARYANRLIVMDKGEMTYNGDVANGFYSMWMNSESKQDINKLPVMMQLLVRLRIAGLPVDCLTVDIKEGITNIIRALNDTNNFRVR